MTNLATDSIIDVTRRLGLLRRGEAAVATPLTGGVSSDVYRVDLPSGPICVKRALGQLQVAADWFAPVSRNAAEVAWMREAGRLLPGSAPRIVANDDAAGVFAMAFLEPDRYPVWKAELMAGRVDIGFAARVGSTLARLHSGAAGNPRLARDFANDDAFDALRVDPYLRFTAARHPDHADALAALAALATNTKTTLIHGDVSPKNLLAGPHGPVFIDAECATYGDPAFDLAFCLSHLLLKSVWAPGKTDAYIACYDALAGAYLAVVDWEPAQAVEARAARYLPGLLLGRIDGKSPIEYVESESDRELMRRFALAGLSEPPPGLGAVRQDWVRCFAAALAA